LKNAFQWSSQVIFIEEYHRFSGKLKPLSTYMQRISAAAYEYTSIPACSTLCP
jgi:hypothetical protein